MKQSYFDKLNLRPQERRLVVGVGLVIFLVLNIWFVWPRFSDWGAVSAEIGTAEQTLSRRQTEVSKLPQYQARIRQLETEGSEVLTEELEFQRIVGSIASSSGLVLNRMVEVNRATTGATNQFFEEQPLIIDYSGAPSQLVNFLVRLASGNSMLRVRELGVRPDPSQTRLLGNMTIVASYQKGPETRAAAATRDTKAVAPKTNSPAPAKARKTPTAANTKKS